MNEWNEYEYEYEVNRMVNWMDEMNMNMYNLDKWMNGININVK